MIRAVKLSTSLALVLLAGCGAAGVQTYPVIGTVTLDGTALPDGYITFTSDDGLRSSTSGMIDNGRFAVRVPAGRRKVEIQASRFVGPEDPVMGQQPQEQYIPDKYNVNSELFVEVTPNGDNFFEFELSDKAR